MNKKLRTFVYPVCAFIVLLLLWQVCVMLSTSEIAFPTPVAVFKEFFYILTHKVGNYYTVVGHVLWSLSRVLVGFYIAAVLGIILGLTMNPGVGRTNIWFHAAAQSSDGTNDVAWYYSSYALSAMPHIQRRYYGETQTTFVEGEWIDWKNDSITTNGYPNCKRVKFVRPEFARGVTLVPNPHAKIGSPNGGFDFGNAVVTVNGRLTFTGYVTNGTKRIYFDNGVNKGEEDIEEDTP